MIKPYEPEPINWKSWKSVLLRLGVPTIIAVLFMIFVMLPEVNKYLNS